MVAAQGRAVPVVVGTLLLLLGSHLEVVQILLLELANMEVVHILRLEVVVPLLLGSLLLGGRQVDLGIQGLHEGGAHHEEELQGNHGLHVLQDTCPVK